MRKVALHRATHFSKPNSNSNARGSGDLNRRGPHDPPISPSPLPPINALLAPFVGSTPQPTDGNDNAPSPQQNPPKPTPTPTPDTENGDGSGNHGSGSGNAMPPGSGNKTDPSNLNGSNLNAPNPDASEPNPSKPNAPKPNASSLNSPTPTPNPYFPDPNLSDPSNPPSTSGSSSSHSSGKPKDGPVKISDHSSQKPNSSDSSGDSSGSGKVVFTTISGVQTKVTQAPYLGNGSTSEGGGGPANGGGGGGPSDGASPSRGRGPGPGAIAAIVVVAVLALALSMFFLRKRAKKRRAVQHARWLSSGEKGPRRSTFGDLRASTFGRSFDRRYGNPNSRRYSGPFSDTMAVSTGPSSAASSTSRVAAIHGDITAPAIAVHSTGRRSSRNSEFSIGSVRSDETDNGEGQWLEMRSNVRYSANGESDPIDRLPLPSPMSVRPFSPSESWSFPKPPRSPPNHPVHSGEGRGFSNHDPFADPAPQLSPMGSPPVGTVTGTFEDGRRWWY